MAEFESKIAPTAYGGLAGFLLGASLTILAEISGVTSVSSIPINAFLPTFTILGGILGYGTSK